MVSKKVSGIILVLIAIFFLLGAAILIFGFNLTGKSIDAGCNEKYSSYTGDKDSDGVKDVCDLCPLIADSKQLDSDGDGVGNACDNCAGSDIDKDGVCDDVDICPKIYNPLISGVQKEVCVINEE